MIRPNKIILSFASDDFKNVGAGGGFSSYFLFLLYRKFRKFKTYRNSNKAANPALTIP